MHSMKNSGEIPISDPRAVARASLPALEKVNDLCLDFFQGCVQSLPAERCRLML